jgi:hypothetical protein
LRSPFETQARAAIGRLQLTPAHVLPLLAAPLAAAAGKKSTPAKRSKKEAGKAAVAAAEGELDGDALQRCVATTKPNWEPQLILSEAIENPTG